MGHQSTYQLDGDFVCCCYKTMGADAWLNNCAVHFSWQIIWCVMLMHVYAGWLYQHVAEKRVMASFPYYLNILIILYRKFTWNWLTSTIHWLFIRPLQKCVVRVRKIIILYQLISYLMYLLALNFVAFSMFF